MGRDARLVGKRAITPMGCYTRCKSETIPLKVLLGGPYGPENVTSFEKFQMRHLVHLLREFVFESFVGQHICFVTDVLSYSILGLRSELGGPSPPR